MSALRLFISSVQKELAGERAAVRDYLRGDPLMRRFFEVFLFEDAPAQDRRADELYLDEVARCDLYVGIFGNEYGYEDAAGVSPTEREFDLATASGKQRLIFVKGTDDGARHPKMGALIRRAGEGLIRRRFGSTSELISNLYAAVVEYLESKQLILNGPFDGAASPTATLADMDPEAMATFIRTARASRQFPLQEGAAAEELLTHLNLLNRGRPTNAAVLLFAREPQRFLISSEVKCAHYHGTEVAKPIPSYQVYKGNVFKLVDQAVDFVLSKISLSVGTRAQSTQVPVSYELPAEAVREGIVNAVAHRDYASNGSVQVMLFADRLEIWNPGALPPSLTVEKLRHPHGSVPFNPLLAEPLYLAKYIERMGTGTGDMIRKCREAGLRAPTFAIQDGFVMTLWRKVGPLWPHSHLGVKPPGPESQAESQPESQPESRPESRPESLEVRILGLLTVYSKSKAAISTELGQQEVSGQLNKVMRQMLQNGMIEYTIPGKPNSRLQQYRLTAAGAQRLREGQTPRSTP